MHRRLALVAGGAVLVAVTVSSGCSSGPSADEELAATLCGALRDHTNDLVDVANDTAAGIYDYSPTERVARVETGYAEADDSLTAWTDTVRALDLPDVAEAEDLRADLLDGIDQGHAEIDDERVSFAETYATMPDEEVRGAIGFWFNSIEKVMSVSEPAIATYDRKALERAFLDEPSCRHVTQQFRVDG
jgi:hypothetical protein